MINSFIRDSLIYPTDPKYNIHYRLTGQLREHLIKNGFCVDEVSRVNIGEKEYYALDFNLKKDEWSHRKTNHTLITKLLGIENIGLVDFFFFFYMIHEVILVDEEELNDKYLSGDNLDFNKKSDGLLRIHGNCEWYSWTVNNKKYPGGCHGRGMADLRYVNINPLGEACECFEEVKRK